MYEPVLEILGCLWNPNNILEMQFDFFVFRGSQSLEKEPICYMGSCFCILSNGAMQSKLHAAGDVCHGLEDVVGSVKGCLKVHA